MNPMRAFLFFGLILLMTVACGKKEEEAPKTPDFVKLEAPSVGEKIVVPTATPEAQDNLFKSGPGKLTFEGSFKNFTGYPTQIAVNVKSIAKSGLLDAAYRQMDKDDLKEYEDFKEKTKTDPLKVIEGILILSETDDITKMAESNDFMGLVFLSSEPTAELFKYLEEKGKEGADRDKNDHKMEGMFSVIAPLGEKLQGEIISSIKKSGKEEGSEVKITDFDSTHHFGFAAMKNGAPGFHFFYIWDGGIIFGGEGKTGNIEELAKKAAYSALSRLNTVSKAGGGSEVPALVVRGGAAGGSGVIQLTLDTHMVLAARVTLPAQMMAQFGPMIGSFGAMKGDLSKEAPSGYKDLADLFLNGTVLKVEGPDILANVTVKMDALKQALPK